MADEVVWEDPPESRRGGRGTRDIYGPIGEALRAKPGQWARIREAVNTGTPVHAKRALGPDFEVVGRNTRPGKRGAVSDVYARYIGPAVKAVS